MTEGHTCSVIRMAVSPGLIHHIIASTFLGVLDVSRSSQSLRLDAEPTKEAAHERLPRRMAYWWTGLRPIRGGHSDTMIWLQT